MKDQPNGFLWLVIFLVVIVLFMVAGYLLEWSINALVARIFFKWPKEKVNRLKFLRHGEKILKANPN